MKGIIVHKSKYGATRQYAEWLAAELKLPVSAAENITPEQLVQYDLIIGGGSVYEGRWLLRKWLLRHAHSLKEKKLVLFIVCGTPPHDKETLDEIARKNIPAHILNTTPVYFLHGRMAVKDLTWGDRAMLRIGAWLMQDPVKKKEMLQDFNDVKKENIASLLKAIRE